ncbi:YslB family protein [Anaerobacillus isosaccharinicus]|uniref:YslB family protein n=1 Tax=Anaerobacillus isosaccharinicus TaxID=1532552 RepID=A0A1S2MF53_9BACI|nr:YslB family protein [Anaerobacillus isosaccharinicus]MBA5587875.1 YslB family protein [Anaerobacillus isosaccharinicus]QOY33971.1 YslB family protein [Anaerobacillus isosaccharinicus]
MIFGQKKTVTIDETELQMPLFGYNLLREDVLPDLLGKEHNIILYWAGKSLARKYLTKSIDELILFFQKAGWGELVLVKEKKSELIFELTSHLFEHKKNIIRPLEAGFIAEQIQHIKGFITETNEESKNGTPKKVIFHVKWDIHDHHI